jgi:hypothetical protein
MQKGRRLRSAPLSATEGAYLLAQALTRIDADRGLGAPMPLGRQRAVVGPGSKGARFWRGFLSYAITSRMSNAVEYVFGANVTLADAFARQQGWRPCSRAAWLKRDGTTVHFLCLMEQLKILATGVTVHVIGRAREPLRILKRLGAITVCHG